MQILSMEVNYNHTNNTGLTSLLLSTKQVKTLLGGYVVDMKYVPNDIFLIEKRSDDSFVGALCCIKFLEDHTKIME